MSGLFDFGPQGGGLFDLAGLAQTKRKIFVSYHHGGDQVYYNAFCGTFCHQYDVIYDSSLERIIDSEDVDYVRRRICEDYVTGSSCTVVLVGRDTWGRKYIDWEIDATLEREHGLIGVQLPSAPVSLVGRVRVPERLLDNIATGYALWITWSEFTHHPANLTSFIETARGRSKYLINNSRARRYRNAVTTLAGLGL
jgi:hypothetical protein